MEKISPIEILRVSGPVGYAQMLAEQKARCAAITRGEASEALFLLEHPPVFTLGREARPEHLLCGEAVLKQQGIDVHQTDRGGDITYHGPGQLVAYPLLNLNYRRRSLNWYLRLLEQTLIDLLEDYGLVGERVRGATGVWVGGAKVAAIGIGVRRWITYHGIALNVAPNMAHFKLIIPCGIPDKPVTSLELLLGTAPAFDQVMERYTQCFLRLFGSR